MTVEPAPESAPIVDQRRPDPPGIRESLKVRALRWLGAYRRFGYWLATIWSGLSRTVEERASAASTGAKPVEQDTTLQPSYYHQAVRELSGHPDRPDLTRFERSSPGEADAIERVAQIISRSVISGYCDVRKADRAAKAMRGQHAKHHGCLKANFIVHEKLPPEFAVGIFRPGATYPAVVRFSNSKGFKESDKSADGRGMAVKLLSVNGKGILADWLPQRGATEQDFLISGHPVFFCRDVPDYTEFMTMLDMPRGTRGESLRANSRFALFFLRRPPRVLCAFIKTAIRRVDSPLEIDYHSMTPYLFGPDRVVRYVATPLAAPRHAKRDRNLLGDNYMHDELVAALNPARHPKGTSIAFDFSIQVKRAPTPKDVEDANRQWRGRGAVRVSLARIEIPMQRFDVADQEHDCENYSFNPWNCLPEHRPLGGLNRMRLAGYMASTRMRHRLNGLG